MLKNDCIILIIIRFEQIIVYYLIKLNALNIQFIVQITLTKHQN